MPAEHSGVVMETYKWKVVVHANIIMHESRNVVDVTEKAE